MAAFIKRRPLLSAAIAVVVVLAALNLLLPYIGGGHGLTAIP
jgi:hypothetical protein